MQKPLQLIIKWSIVATRIGSCAGVNARSLWGGVVWSWKWGWGTQICLYTWYQSQSSPIIPWLTLGATSTNSSKLFQLMIESGYPVQSLPSGLYMLLVTSPLMLVCFWVPVYLHPGRLPYSNPKPIFTHWTLLLWIGKLDRHSVLWLPHSDVYVQYNFNYIRISCQFWTAMMWIIILLTIHWLLDDFCDVEYFFFALTNRFQLLCEMSGSCAHCILWLSWY